MAGCTSKSKDKFPGKSLKKHIEQKHQLNWGTFVKVLWNSDGLTDLIGGPLVCFGPGRRKALRFPDIEKCKQFFDVVKYIDRASLITCQRTD